MAREPLDAPSRGAADGDGDAAGAPKAPKPARRRRSDGLRSRQAILRAADRRHAEEADAERVLGRLTPRESDVLDHLRRGHSAEEIARADHVALSTVRAQIRSVLAKLGVRSQLQAVARANALTRRLGPRRHPAPAKPTREGTHPQS